MSYKVERIRTRTLKRLGKGACFELEGGLFSVIGRVWDGGDNDPVEVEAVTFDIATGSFIHSAGSQTFPGNTEVYSVRSTPVTLEDSCIDSAKIADSMVADAISLAPNLTGIAGFMISADECEFSDLVAGDFFKFSGGIFRKENSDFGTCVVAGKNRPLWIVGNEYRFTAESSVRRAHEQRPASSPVGKPQDTRAHVTVGMIVDAICEDVAREEMRLESAFVAELQHGAQKSTAAEIIIWTQVHGDELLKQQNIVRHNGFVRIHDMIRNVVLTGDLKK